MIKNVAEFHSFDFAVFLIVAFGELFRHGLGIIFIQNDFCVIEGRLAYVRGRGYADVKFRGGNIAREERILAGAITNRRNTMVGLIAAKID